MDMRYKSFVPRSKSDHNFDQIMRNTSKYSQDTYGNKFNRFQATDSINVFSDRSSGLSSNRKKVNVVTFTPDESNERVAKSIGMVTNSENSLDDSPSYDFSKVINPTLPTMLNSHHSFDLSPEIDPFTINTPPKFIAVKRKAVKEQPIKEEISKKKFSPTFTFDASVKRAVSPEILNPEPNYKNTEVKLKKCKSKPIMKPNLSKGSNSIPSSKECFLIDMPKMKQISQEDNSVNQGRPIINYKKNKVSYNPRPWQNNMDDDFDEYRLKSENIIYNNEDCETTCQMSTTSSEFRHYSSTSSTVVTQKVENRSKSNVNEHKNSTIPSKPLLTESISENDKYPAVQNVKEAYECQETGETQDLLDDVEYLIEGLKGQVRATTKTLSIISLIGKCLTKSFRDMLKAHGLVYKIFNYLSDANSDESIALTTAGLFFVFSRDRQPRVFQDQSLSMLLKLPESERAQSQQDHLRTCDKLRLVLDKLHNNTLKSSIKNSNMSLSFQRRCLCCRHLKLDSTITTEDLVVECVLQLTTRKTIDWFKDQMRKLLGIDLICKQIEICVEYLGSDLGPQCLDEFVLDRMFRLFNYMRFLEHMTFQNRDNQSYLIDYKDGALISNLCRCLKLCAANLSFQINGTPEKKLIEACLMAILRLLANITHDNEWASNQLGCCKGLLKLIFSCLLHLPRFMSSGKRFDLSVLALALLINLAEHCSENRMRMAHVTVSRKRVACLGLCGQYFEDENEYNNRMKIMLEKKNNRALDKMEFGFYDEQEEEDMDLDDEDDNGEFDEDEFTPTQYIDFDADSDETRINVLEALVKLFLRHDDRAKNNTIIEGNEEKTENVTEENQELVANGSGEAEYDSQDPKWRIIQDKESLRKKKHSSSHHKYHHKMSGVGGVLSDSEEEGSSDEEGADVEFLIESKEEEVELQKKLSAAGQHMQDSVVSAYTALLLGCIIKGSSPRFMECIREHLPDGKFKLLAFVLAKFLSIISITSGMGQSSEESILEIVRLLEAQDNIGNNTDDGIDACNDVDENGVEIKIDNKDSKQLTITNDDDDCQTLSYSRYKRDYDIEDDDDEEEEEEEDEDDYNFSDGDDGDK